MATQATLCPNRLIQKRWPPKECHLPKEVTTQRRRPTKGDDRPKEFTSQGEDRPKEVTPERKLPPKGRRPTKGDDRPKEFTSKGEDRPKEVTPKRKLPPKGRRPTKGGDRPKEFTSQRRRPPKGGDRLNNVTPKVSYRQSSGRKESRLYSRLSGLEIRTAQRSLYLSLVHPVDREPSETSAETQVPNRVSRQGIWIKTV